ncbi:MAG TPA: sigma factor-like helix-turn-helix DNA-binding protein [Urbifossiella sp.]|jgi:DNA-directed RNA polymerase specialized sigma24 family protein|nr:sigma factor-like helix-turn-helix DNA-binding protein [Urbifossiella sp.]
MVAPRRPSPGVPLTELRAAVLLARASADAVGTRWSIDTWERVWVRLTESQQRVVYLHVLVGLSHTAIADQLGVSRSSIQGAWRRALDRIRDVVPSAN